jgi:crotonobetainyl-CoA:carnitine CoA-transferase CaiB-like acyl-CoA transferase
VSVLDGIRVLDLSWGFAGAMATLVLADYGAEVIRLEPPAGDPLRAEPGFALWGRGKRSVVLDFRSDSGRETARRLAQAADVVVASFRPGSAERLGLAYDDIAPTNPRLVYASITGFGTRGPLARLKGYEAIVMAKMGGLDHAGGMAPRAGPAYPAVPFASFGAAHTALHGILAALYVRERTGRGQLIETSLVQGLAAYDPWEGFLRVICEKFPQGYTPTPPVSENGVPNTGFLFRLLVCLTRDGRWLQFSQTSPHLFREFIDALGLAWIWTHPRWATAPDFESEADRSAFWDLLLCAAREKTLAEWQAVFAERPNVWAEIFRTTREAMDHPQMRHNGAVIRVDDPRGGPSEQLAPLVTMARTPARVRAPAPALGEHTAAVLGALDTTARAPTPPPAPAEPSGPPLAGVTVLELGLFYAAPYGPALLADLGARVIKIEPLGGEPMRHIMPIPDAGAAKVLQGKESVALDLATPEGRAIVHRLARQTDLVMVSYRGGVAAKLGVDYETLRRENPRLVYLSAPGYGVDGPCARKPAYAPTIGAAMGFARAQAGPGVPHGADLTLEEIRPASLRLGAAAQAPGNADGCSALGVATALLLGLLARARTGEGQELRTSMLSTSAYAVSAECDAASGQAPHRTPDPLLLGLSALYRLYQTDDGWIFLACPQPHEWAPLCRALADASLADDVRFGTVAAREANDTALAATLEDVFRRRGAAAWESLCLAHDVACAAVAPGPVAAQAMSHPLMRENGFLADAEHPIYGTYRRLAPLVRLAGTPSTAGPCTLGEHTERVLGELGYDAAAIADLVRRQIARTAT